ncbi:MAG: hypothetical protein ACI8SE_000749 [Bacteroidia bacterium]|jgi:hypothetical protein
MNKKILKSILLVLRVGVSAFGMYLLFRLLYASIVCVVNQKIKLPFLVPQSDYAILFIIAYPLIMTLIIYKLVYYKWIKGTIIVSLSLISVLLIFLYAKTATGNMQSEHFPMGKESLTIYTEPGSSKYVGKYKGFFQRTYFYGEKRDSADYLILDEPASFLGDKPNGGLRLQTRKE